MKSTNIDSKMICQRHNCIEAQAWTWKCQEQQEGTYSAVSKVFVCIVFQPPPCHRRVALGPGTLSDQELKSPHSLQGSSPHVGIAFPISGSSCILFFCLSVCAVLDCVVSFLAALRPRCSRQKCVDFYFWWVGIVMVFATLHVFGVLSLYW